jgi:hypothetical protein
MSSWSSIRFPKNWCVYSELHPLEQEQAAEDPLQNEPTLASSSESVLVSSPDSKLSQMVEEQPVLPPVVLDDTITLEYWELTRDEFAVPNCKPVQRFEYDSRLYHKHQITLKPKQCTKSSQVQNAWTFTCKTDRTSASKGKMLTVVLSYSSSLCEEKHSSVSTLDFINQVLL